MSWYKRRDETETVLWKDKDWAIVRWVNMPTAPPWVPRHARTLLAVYHRKHDGWSAWNSNDEEYMSIGQMRKIIIPGYITKKMKYFAKIRRLL